MIIKTGQCLCGAVKFEAEIADLTYDVCHCGMCRRWAGGPFFGVSSHKVTILEGADFARAFKTSDWASRVHCAQCGGNLWYKLDQAEFHAVSVGALDDQSDMTLVEEVFVDWKPAGYGFAGPLKQKTEADVLAAFAPPEGTEP